MSLFKSGIRAVLLEALRLSSDVPATWRLVWEAAPGWPLLWGGLLVIRGLLPPVTIVLTRFLVDALAQLPRSGEPADIRNALFFAALLGGSVILTELLRTALGWVHNVLAEVVTDHVAKRIHRQSVAVDLAFYETPEFYDHLHRARDDASQRPLALFESAGISIQEAVTLVSMAAVLGHYGAWLPLLLVASTLPAFFVIVYFHRRHHQWWELRTADRRWTRYCDLVLTSGWAAPELRLFGLGPYFSAAYQETRRQLRSDRVTEAKKQAMANFGAGAVGFITAASALGIVGLRVVHGRATLGDLALLYQAFSRGQRVMQSLLHNVGEIYANSLFLRNLFAFLKLRPKIADPPHPVTVPVPLQNEIVFKDVMFRYPEARRPVLAGMNLRVPIGRTIAIVGPNGSGKSTLVKLLCRFYEPQSGCIELDGIDIRSFLVDDLLRAITVVFQEPVCYHAAAAGNISLGDLQIHNHMADIEAAARSAGAHELITGLPHGYDTLIGRWFGAGRDLSTGEWQRVALARAYFRKAQIIILDEPTAAMDSWAEVEWFERFRVQARGRTAIIITHRFTVAMRADTIHVMKSGRIVESGNHDELLLRGGVYASSWQAQTTARSQGGESESPGAHWQ